MTTALVQLVDDFVSAFVFMAVFAWTRNLTVASVSAILVARGQPASGGLTLITQDSRFIRIKPTLAHFATPCAAAARRNSVPNRDRGF